ncbi:MAG: L,D-transpeptidase, partial [Firmicutes bacterium]|nr:L,D-transpeptidase [Bacillota bacterium]
MGKKGKIVAVAAAVVLLCGCIFAKTEYDKWHEAQPLAVAHAAVAALAEAVPEAEIDAETTGMEGKFEAGLDSYVFQALDKSGRALGEITVEATGKNLLEKPLYEATQIRGLVQTEVIGAKESTFAAEDRGAEIAITENDESLFGSRAMSHTVDGLFTDLQIEAGEGYTLVKAQEGRLYLTVPDADEESEYVREALSEGLTNELFPDGEEVKSLELTDPLFLDEETAVVFARYLHGDPAEAGSESRAAFYMRLNSRGFWNIRAEAPDEESLLPYTEEDVFDLPLYMVPPKDTPRSHPYYIMVNRQMNTVTVYEKGKDGSYTEPIKAMICSCGREGHETPTGDFKIMSFKAEWCYMIDGSYGQYATAFRDGGYLFHSICYTNPDSSTMMADEYNALGDFASAGCVR